MAGRLRAISSFNKTTRKPPKYSNTHFFFHTYPTKLIKTKPLNTNQQPTTNTLFVFFTKPLFPPNKMSMEAGQFGPLVGGAIAQGAEVLAFGHLLDRVKVEQQVQMKPARAVLSSMYRRGGMAELYKGMGYNLTQALLKGGSRWCVVGGSDAIVSAAITPAQRKQRPVLFNGLVGTLAGLLETTFVSCPLESVKIAEMTGGAHAAYKREGARMLWNGWTSQVVKQVITWCTFLMAFEHVRQLTYKMKGSTQLEMSDKVMIGVGTGAISTFVQAPADLAKTLSQTSAEATKTGRGMYSTLSWVVRNKGPSALFAGMSTKLIRHCSTATIMLVTMDHLNCLPEGMKL